MEVYSIAAAVLIPRAHNITSEVSKCRTAHLIVASMWAITAELEPERDPLDFPAPGISKARILQPVDFASGCNSTASARLRVFVCV